MRSPWRNKSAMSVDEGSRGRSTRAMTDGGSEDETETATTWRAYRATTFDTEDSVNSGNGGGGNAAAQKGAKPSPAEVYMRKISQSPPMETGGLGRAIPHAPVTSQSWSRSYSQQPPASDNLDPSPNPSHSPASWRRQIPSSDLGTSYDRISRTPGASSRGGEPWSSRGQGLGARAEGRSGAGGRPWSQRQSEQH